MSETQKKSDFPAVGWDDLIRKTNGRLEHLGLTLGVAKEVVTALVETVVDELGNDQRVRLKGLGTLTPRLYGGHTMNTPNVGEEGRVIKKQRVIRFNQSRIASAAINAKPLPGEKKAAKKAKADKKGATEEPVKKAKKAVETEAVPEKKAKAVKAETAPSEEPKKAKKAKPEAEEAPKKAKKAKPVDEDEDEDEE
jgi:nucleoid DNA-binding protein